MDADLKPEDFHMPAEWEIHEGTWLQWPHDDQLPGYQMKLEKTWLEMVAALHEHERVHIVVPDERRREHVEAQLRFFGIQLERVDFFIIATNDVWARDNGPIFVRDHAGHLAVTNWTFNGWGQRFAHEMDDRVPPAIANALGLPLFSPPLVLEGGAVEVNGAGVFMASRSSIINPNRNPGKSRKEIEGIIARHLGVKCFVWLSGSTEAEDWGDDTDTHVDIAARFVNPTTILYNWTDDDSDPRAGMFRIHYQELCRARDACGQPFTLVPLPVPRNGVYSTSNLSLREASGGTPYFTDAAYSNFLIANGMVLVPVFGNVDDGRALKIIAEHFPGHRIVGINCVALNENGGAIHYVTQQQPLAKMEERS